MSQSGHVQLIAKISISCDRSNYIFFSGCHVLLKTKTLAWRVTFSRFVGALYGQIEMMFAVPGRSGVTIELQNESWLMYCGRWDFPVMLRKQKNKTLGSCLCCMYSKNENCSYG